jgi:hypothetical protein
MKKRTIEYAVSTTKRPVDYIHRMLPAVASTGPVRLFVCGPDLRYLISLPDTLPVQIECTPREDWQRLRGQSVAQRATWNYWRCLNMWSEGTGRDGVLVLEDDIFPAPGWRDWFLTTIDQIEARYGERYVLSLYSSRKWLPANADDTFAVYPVPKFAGTQGVYYPESVRGACARFLEYYGVELNEAPYDMLVAEHLLRSNTLLFVTVPSLVQHIGQVGTGLSEFHESPDFTENLSTRVL